MQKILHLILLAVLILPGCKSEDFSADCADFPLKDLAGNANDIAIYNAVIQEYYSEVDFIHVVQESGNEIEAEWIFSYLEDATTQVDSATVYNYETANDQYDLIGQKIKKPARLIASAEIDCLRSFDGYYAKYPNSKGYITFNNIGYNESKTMALVEFGAFSAPLAATGSFIILEKQAGSWVIIERIYTWIS